MMPLTLQILSSLSWAGVKGSLSRKTRARRSVKLNEEWGIMLTEQTDEDGRYVRRILSTIPDDYAHASVEVSINTAPTARGMAKFVKLYCEREAKIRR